MGHPQPLCTGACARDHHPHSEELLPIIKYIPTLFHFYPITPCPVTTVPEEESLSRFPVAPSLPGKVLQGLPASFSSPASTAPTFPAFPYREGAPVPSATSWPPLALSSFPGNNRGHQLWGCPTTHGRHWLGNCQSLGALQFPKLRREEEKMNRSGAGSLNHRDGKLMILGACAVFVEGLMMPLVSLPGLWGCLWWRKSRRTFLITDV